MLFLKNYSKLVKTFIHLIVLVLAVLAIVFTYTKELFIGDEAIIKDFAMWTYKPVSYTLLNLTGFSNVFIEYSGKLTQVNHIIEFKQYMVDAANTMKVLVIAVIALNALFAIGQLFTFRVVATFNLCLANLLAIILLVSFAINGFEETKLITSYNSSYITIMILWIVATLFTFLELAYDSIVEKISSKNEVEPVQEN